MITLVFLASVPVAFISPTAASLLWLPSFLGRGRLRRVAGGLRGG